MYPFLQTWRSLTRPHLLSTVFYCALLAVAVLVAVVVGATWITDRLVSLETGWLDSLVNWGVALVGGLRGGSCFRRSPF